MDLSLERFTSVRFNLIYLFLFHLSQLLHNMKFEYLFDRFYILINVIFSRFQLILIIREYPCFLCTASKNKLYYY